MSEITRFTLEDQLSDCAGILNQIETLIKSIADDGNVDPDFLLNYLIGVKTIYASKFQHAQQTMDDLIVSGKLK